MFGIGVPELLIILAIALIVIGPKKLPDLAKALGRSLNEFKKATREFKDSLDIEEDIKSVKKPFSEINRDIRSAVIDLPLPDQKKSTGSPLPADTISNPAAPAENIASQNQASQIDKADATTEDGKKTDD